MLSCASVPLVCRTDRFILGRRIRISLDEPLPKHPLCLPVWDDRNGGHFAFAEAGDVVGGGFEVEDCFLDVRGELGEVDDLRYAGTGDASGAGDLGLVFHLSGGEQMFESNGQRHQLGDVRKLGRCAGLL